jgi:hypothetical protein
MINSEIIHNQTSNANSIKISHNKGTHYITAMGRNDIPKFPIFLVIADILGVAIVLIMTSSRMRYLNQHFNIWGKLELRDKDIIILHFQAASKPSSAYFLVCVG